MVNLKQHKLIAVFSQLVGPAFAPIFTIIFVYELGVEVYGQFAVWLASIMLARGILNLNLWVGFSASLRKNPNHEFLVYIRYRNFEYVISLFACILYWVFSFLLFESENVLYGCLLIFSLGDTVTRAFLRYSERFITIASIDVFAWSLLILIFILNSDVSASTGLQLYALSKLITFIAMAILASARSEKSSSKIELDFIEELKKWGTWSYASACVRMGVTHGLTILIGASLGLQSAGVHGIGMQIIKVFGTLSQALLQLAHTDKSLSKSILDELYRAKCYLAMISIISVLSVFIGSYYIINVISNSLYAVLLVYIISGNISIFTFPIAPILFSMGRYQQVFIINVLSSSVLFVPFSFTEVNLILVAISLVMYQLIFASLGYYGCRNTKN